MHLGSSASWKSKQTCSDKINVQDKTLSKLFKYLREMPQSLSIEPLSLIRIPLDILTLFRGLNARSKVYTERKSSRW